MPTTTRNETVQVRGQIDRVFFASPTFSAGRLKTDGRDYISFAGNLFATEGDHVSLAGTWEKHPKYGRQFKVDHVAIEMPQDAEGLARYLANHPEIKGIGPAKARAIAERFGGDFDRALEEQPEALAEAAHVPLTTIETLREHWRKTRNVNAALTWLSAYGLTHHQASTLVERLGNNVVAVLQDDPYLIIREIRGMGFKKVDQVARKLGTPKEHLPRVRAGVLHCVQEALDQGDCWVEYEDLIDRANTLLIMDCLDSRERIEKELDGLVDSGKLACNDLGGRFVVGMPWMLHNEQSIAERIAGDHMGNPHLGCIDNDIAETFAQGLSAAQRLALQNAIKYRMSLISGGAGTGKTRTIQSIVSCYEAADLDVALAAPTGKAAKRMEEVTGRAAFTLHRLLEYDGVTFTRDAINRLDTDLIIVDEMSMTDSLLFARFLSAVDKNTALVFVGDHNQLPPVGPGNPLGDLIEKRAVPTVVLEKVFRQSGALKENSAAILAGQVRKTSDKQADGRCDWYLVDQFTDPSGVAKCLHELFENVLEEKLGFDLLSDVQVLTPTHKGPLGTRDLNVMLQRIVQRKRFGVEVPEVVGNRWPRILKGDKVIQMRNDYGLDVMNGATGVVEDIEEDGSLVVVFDGRSVTYASSEGQPNNLHLAFVTTVHKAQGSEYPCVVAVVHKSHAFMHNARLFYTAVTRAQKTAIILGDRWGVRNCAKKVSTHKRATFLSYLLQPTGQEAAV
jgi:exodeoxyribonuclease V alpha subunit